MTARLELRGTLNCIGMMLEQEIDPMQNFATIKREDGSLVHIVGLTDDEARTMAAAFYSPFTIHFTEQV